MRIADMMRIAIASGKGGTGKTTIAASLAQTLSREKSLSVLVSDCDVEGPNLHLYLQPDFKDTKPVFQMIPEVDNETCTGCGICADVCQFNAIVVLNDKPLVFPELCHGCGSCTLTCPEAAIREVPVKIGMLMRGPGKSQINLRQGTLDIGEPQAVPIISALKKWYFPEIPDLEIIDSPPGASCPVVEALRGADYVLLVTEPTPFGLHDLKQAYQVTEELGLHAGVIINRASFDEKGVREFCLNHDLPILLQIPLDQQIGEGIARGKTLVEIFPEYEEEFIDMYEDIKKRLLEC